MGQLPSIDQVMPWLHLIFEAWDDYKRTRKLERKTKKSVADDIEAEGPDDTNHDDEDKKKKRKRKK